MSLAKFIKASLEPGRFAPQGAAGLSARYFVPATPDEVRVQAALTVVQNQRDAAGARHGTYVNPVGGGALLRLGEAAEIGLFVVTLAMLGALSVAVVALLAQFG
jgi:hypothetical protein